MKRITDRRNKEYFAILARERRARTINYFRDFNDFEIEPRDLDEKKIFNSSDLHYIRKMKGD